MLAFCGIAHPRRFLDLLASEGLSPTKFFTFPDHHTYPPASIARLQQQYLSSRATALVTTEKDALKLVTIPEALEMSLYYLKIDLDIEEDFFPEVLRRLQGGPQVS